MRRLFSAACSALLLAASNLLPASASATTYGGVTARVNANSTVDVIIPGSVLAAQGTLTKFSPTGSQVLHLAPGGDTYFDTSPGAWACYFFNHAEVRLPAVCVVPNSRSGAAPSFTILTGGAHNNSAYGLNTASLNWDGVATADGYRVLRTSGLPVDLDLTQRGWYGGNLGWDPQPIQGVACFMLAVMRQGQVIGTGDITCVVPNQGSAQTTMAPAPTTPNSMTRR